MQSDPVLVAIYGIGVIPLINMPIGILITEQSLSSCLAYADDFSVAGSLKDLRI